MPAEVADAVIIGSPCHFGGPSAAVKKFMDSTWPIRGKLAGKVGAVFAASEHLAGGHELTMISCTPVDSTRAPMSSATRWRPPTIQADAESPIDASCIGVNGSARAWATVG